MPAALGTDTGGSIRQPAALCGVTGLKPTYGRVSRYGLVAFASSLDQIGPITRSCSDAALVLGAIAGHDRHDATSYPAAARPTGSRRSRATSTACASASRAASSTARARTPRRWRARAKALRTLEGLGAKTVEVELPNSAYGIGTYYLICTAEASSNLSRYDGVKYGFRAASETLDEMYENTRSEGFGAEVKRRILLGTYVLSAGYYDAYYRKAQQVRTLIRRDFERAFESCDLIATPTTPGPAWRIGERVDDPLQMYLADVYTVTANLAGLARDLDPVRLHGRGSAGRLAADRASARRSDRAARGRRLPAPDPPSRTGSGGLRELKRVLRSSPCSWSPCW